MPECPICIENKSHRSILHMECRHDICIDCASKWLPIHSSCPLCRQMNECFSLSTRSKKKAAALLFVVRAYVDSIDFNNFHIEEFVEFVDSFILPHHHCWYRPRMIVFIRQLQLVVSKHSMDMSRYLNKKQKEVLIQFLRV
uniref:RING-type domain-containing protein n=1 Tax=viral metagenome TaxID=1070528 RepID=A0A6C0CYY5_9ZZZZ